MLRRDASTRVLSVVLALAAVAAVTARQDAVARFSADVQLVEVYATVTDARGEIVTGLRQDDFEVHEDNQLQHASTFAAGEFPLTVALDVPRERVSIVARSHDEEGAVALAGGASPGAEIEDSAQASRLGELGAHLLAAMALVMPGIGPIVADGPLAAGLGEAVGHAAGGIARTLEGAGLDQSDAQHWEARIHAAAVLSGQTWRTRD